MGMIEELNERINKGEASYVEKAIQPTFNWETAVGYLAHCADTEFGEPVGLLTFRLPKADDIDSIKPVKNYLSENIDKEILGIDMLVSLTTRNEIKYSATNDVLLWNSIGSGRLVLKENVRLLEPGDLIFIPKGMEYSIKPESAQVVCVIALQQEI